MSEPEAPNSPCQRCGSRDDAELRPLWLANFADITALGVPFQHVADPHGIVPSWSSLFVCQSCVHDWLVAMARWLCAEPSSGDHRDTAFRSWEDQLLTTMRQTVDEARRDLARARADLDRAVREFDLVCLAGLDVGLDATVFATLLARARSATRAPDEPRSGEVER